MFVVGLGGMRNILVFPMCATCAKRLILRFKAYTCLPTAMSSVLCIIGLITRAYGYLRKLEATRKVWSSSYSRIRRSNVNVYGSYSYYYEGLGMMNHLILSDDLKVEVAS